MFSYSIPGLGALRRSQGLCFLGRQLCFVFLAISLTLVGAYPLKAQLAPNSVDTCRIDVVFEPVAGRKLIGFSNHWHAIVVIGNTAFEANPSGNYRDWGHLVGQRRSLRSRPLKPDHMRRAAGNALVSCYDVMRKAASATREVNAARLPYSPVPELRWNSVNSNSFSHFLVRRLGLTPPSAPWPPASGFVPGYHDAIVY